MLDTGRRMSDSYSLAASFVMALFLAVSTVVVLAIVAMPLTAMSAVFIGLWITGIELNISAMME